MIDSSSRPPPTTLTAVVGPWEGGKMGRGRWEAMGRGQDLSQAMLGGSDAQPGDPDEPAATATTESVHASTSGEAELSRGTASATASAVDIPNSSAADEGEP